MCESIFPKLINRMFTASMVQHLVLWYLLHVRNNIYLLIALLHAVRLTISIQLAIWIGMIFNRYAITFTDILARVESKFFGICTNSLLLIWNTPSWRKLGFFFVCFCFFFFLFCFVLVFKSTSKLSHLQILWFLVFVFTCQNTKVRKSIVYVRPTSSPNALRINQEHSTDD